MTSGQLIFNLLGPISTSMLILILSKYEMDEKIFNSMLKSIWFPSISLLVFVFIKTPSFDELELTLKASFSASGGFGSNQVSTVLGVGMFLSFYAWINKLKFSGYHFLDGFSLELLLFKGF